MKRRHFASLALAQCLGCLGVGCQPREVCGGASPSCGGDLTGTWDLVVSSCQDQSYRAPFQVSLDDQPVEFAREVPPERTGTDWCNQLILRNGAVQSVRLQPQNVPVVGGSMTYTAEGTYTGLVRFVGNFSQRFSRACLTAHGDNPTCAEFDAAMKDFIISSSGLSSISCVDGTGGACDCTYSLAQDPAFNGTYTIEGSLLTHFDSFQQLPNEVDYCVSNNQLEMVGHQRGFLWDRFGLRGLVWTRTAVP